MDLFDMLGGLPVPQPGRSGAGGRKPQAELTFHISRSLEEADLPLLLNPPPQGTPAGAPLVQIRQTHHALARALAEGMTQEEASLVSGYSPSWISSLKGDPAFAQLLEYYAAQKAARYVDVVERRKNAGLAALDVLQERLEKDPDSWSKGELMQMVELGVGKVGAGAVSPQAPVAPIQISFVAPEPRPEPPKALQIDAVLDE